MLLAARGDPRGRVLRAHLVDRRCTPGQVRPRQLLPRLDGRHVTIGRASRHDLAAARLTEIVAGRAARARRRRRRACDRVRPLASARRSACRRGSVSTPASNRWRSNRSRRPERPEDPCPRCRTPSADLRRGVDRRRCCGCSGLAVRRSRRGRWGRRRLARSAAGHPHEPHASHRCTMRSELRAPGYQTATSLQSCDARMTHSQRVRHRPPA